MLQGPAGLAGRAGLHPKPKGMDRVCPGRAPWRNRFGRGGALRDAPVETKDLARVTAMVVM